jgi:hypothetical protein
VASRRRAIGKENWLNERYRRKEKVERKKA